MATAWNVETLAAWMERNEFKDAAGVCRSKGVDGLLLSNMTQEEIAKEFGVSDLQAKKIMLHLQEASKQSVVPAASAPPPVVHQQPMMQRRRGPGVVGGAAVGAAKGAAKGAVAGAILPGVDTKDAAGAGAAVGAMSGGGKALRNRMMRR